LLLDTGNGLHILEFFDGKTKPLAEIRSEVDRREKKIASWLDELQKSK
jgi:hypothetical protein